MRHICAPVVTLPKAKIGAPAMTNFAQIFVCSEATPGDKLTLLKHEQAHIWLRHNARKCPGDRQDLWTVALEVEIARNIYNEDDLTKISNPLSVLHGGYTPASFPDMPPSINLAEDIYEWLVNNPDKTPPCKSCMTVKIIEGEPPPEGAEGGEPLTPEEIDAIQKAVVQRSEDLRVKFYPKQHLTMPKPTLASTIDYILRAAFTREQSYMRPSRKQDTEFILKGYKRRRKSPHVEIFIDRSGSFHGERTRLSELKINSILQRYRARLQSDVFYFSNGKLYTHDVPASGGNPYPLVMEHLEKSRPRIAVIMTDDDMEGKLQPLSHKFTQIICVPIGVERTSIASVINAIDLKD